MDAGHLPSNRSFGALFVLVFAALGAWSWWKGGWATPHLFVLAGVLLLVTLLRADWLAPLNRAWMRVALVLNGIVLGSLWLLRGPELGRSRLAPPHQPAGPSRPPVEHWRNRQGVMKAAQYTRNRPCRKRRISRSFPRHSGCRP